MNVIPVDDRINILQVKCAGESVNSVNDKSCMRSKYIRFFISSTFADMKVERDLLQEVFYEIVPIYKEKGWQIETVDLRWGISTEAGYHNKTMQICEQELKRCQQLSPKPNFIILLGNRYGWIPLPEKITMHDFEEMRMTKEEKALFDKWYLLDTNALPDGQYLLKARTGDYRKDDIWKEQAEKPLKELFFRNTKHKLTFFQRLFANRQSPFLQDFGLSATEQEIRLGALNIDDACEHVIAYFRNLTDIPDDKRANFIESDKECAEQLTNLKKKLHDKLDNSNVYSVNLSYDCYRQEPFELAFKQQMRMRITNIIDRTIEDSNHDTTNSENAFHLAIAAEEADGFVGRETELNFIDSYLRDQESFRALWIKSPSGAGKTALLAKVVETYKDDFHVICRFCGRSIDSSSAISLLRSIWWDLHQGDSRKCNDIKKYMDFPGQHHKPWECIKCKLEKMESDNPVLVVVDAINQAEEDTEGFSLLKWLDFKLSPAVKVIVSSTDELRYSFASEHISIYSLHDMGNDAWSQVQRQLSRHGRDLTQKQRKQVMCAIKQSDRSAIFLDVLGKCLCSVTSTTELDDLPHTLTTLVGYLMDNLSRPENHGTLIVRKVMSLLVSDRVGLSQTEILDLLSHDEEFYAQVKHDSLHELPKTDERHIPPILWSRLLYDLEPLLRHLTTKAGQVLSIFHSELRQAIANNYLSTQKEQIKTFQSLYQYYYLQTDQDKNTPHALLEVIYCAVKLMDYTRKCNKEVFQSTGREIYHLLIDNARFLTLKALHYAESLMNDYLLAMPYFGVNEQRLLISVQRLLMKAANLTVINDSSGNIGVSRARLLPNEEHFLCYLRNLPSTMPLRKAIEGIYDTGIIMENTLTDCDHDKDDGTIFVIPRLGKMPRMSDDATKVASLFENNHQIIMVDLREPLNEKKINVAKQVHDMHFSHDMHYVAIQVEDSCFLYDTVNSKCLYKKTMSKHGIITLSSDGRILAMFNNGEIEVVDIHDHTSVSYNSLLCGKISPSGKYVWAIDETHILHRYDYNNGIDAYLRTFNPQDINEQAVSKNDEKKKTDPRPTRIIACSDSCCAVDYKDMTCCLTFKEGANSCERNYYTPGYLIYGENNDILFNKRGYLLIRNQNSRDRSQSLQIDLLWSCASPDLSLILSETYEDKFARIVDVRKVQQRFNAKSSGNNGVNSLTCSYDGHKIWCAYGFNFAIDYQEAIARIIDGKKTAWIPPVGKEFQFVTQVSASPDGSLLALSIQHYLDNGGCEFMVVTSDNKTVVRQNTGDYSAIGIAFSEDGHYLLAKTGHLINLPDPTVFLFNCHGKKMYESSEHKDLGSDDFICFSRNNRYVIGGGRSHIDLLEPAVSTKQEGEIYTIVPSGMMAVRFKHFCVQPPVGNGFLSSDKGGNIYFNHLDSNKRSVFKLLAPYQPMACSPSGRFIYLLHKGKLSVWDWIGTQQIIKLMDHVQWIVPALDDNHIYVICDDYMILLLNIATEQVEQKAFMGRTVFQKACAQGLAVTNDYCEIALLHPDPSLHVNTPAPTTFVRHWNLEQRKLQSPVAVCPACGHHISMSKRLSDVLKPAPESFENIHRSDWDDSRLYGYKCSYCNSSLSFNPYIL